jgi:hypothetical protein
MEGTIPVGTPVPTSVGYLPKIEYLPSVLRIHNGFNADPDSNSGSRGYLLSAKNKELNVFLIFFIFYVYIFLIFLC